MPRHVGESNYQAGKLVARTRKARKRRGQLKRARQARRGDNNDRS